MLGRGCSVVRSSPDESRPVARRRWIRTISLGIQGPEAGSKGVGAFIVDNGRGWSDFFFIVSRLW